LSSTPAPHIGTKEERKKERKRKITKRKMNNHQYMVT
jgi:hypothetical protein